VEQSSRRRAQHSAAHPSGVGFVRMERQAGSGSFVRTGGGSFVRTGSGFMHTGAFRVWHTWANWAKNEVKPYLNTTHTYGYSYPVTEVFGF
jgi:hypothetical protein